MSLMDQILKIAQKEPQIVAFPEATDKKMLYAAKEAADSGICHPILVGSEMQIQKAAADYCISLEKMKIFDTDNQDLFNSLIQVYIHKRSEYTEKTMKRKAKNPLYVALMLEATDQVDCTFAGISCSTGDVILAAQFVIGMKPGISTASSFAIFDIPGYDGPEGTLLAFGDSAVCVNPSANELADIAITACESIQDLCGWTPRCALLSYSTNGSAESDLVEKVKTAVALAQAQRPDLLIDGEFQLDAAINPLVAEKKVKRASEVAGKANIIIWPDLNVGNISVKLVQQFAHANAYGPSLQGFAKVVSDCSRSASIPELVGNIAISCVRSYKEKARRAFHEDTDC